MRCNKSKRIAGVVAAVGVGNSECNVCGAEKMNLLARMAILEQPFDMQIKCIAAYQYGGRQKPMGDA
ncbi:MAG: hypothetical protein RSB97_08445 [Christensenella sp.]